jgi:hypothetical protein
LWRWWFRRPSEVAGEELLVEKPAALGGVDRLERALVRVHLDGLETWPDREARPATPREQEARAARGRPRGAQPKPRGPGLHTQAAGR